MADQPPSSVFNISNHPINRDELNLLEKGMNYIPVNPHWNNTIWQRDILDFTRKLKLAWHFEDRPTTSRIDRNRDFKNLNRPLKSDWQPPLDSLNATQKEFITDLERELRNFRPPKQRDNLSRGERKALKTLKENQHWIIKPADKGSGTVLWALEDYKAEALSQLNSHYYKKLAASELIKVYKHTNRIRTLRSSQQPPYYTFREKGHVSN